MKRNPLVACMVVLAVVLLIAAAEKPRAGNMRILFFSPTTEGNTYWPKVYRVLEAVASDLHISVVPYEFSVKDRFAKSIEGKEILKKPPVADGAIFSVAFGQTRPLLETAETLGIPAFIQGPLFSEELPEIGYLPRNKFDCWVGYFQQDEEKKGYLLAKKLIQAAQEKGALGEDERIHVAGVGGDRTWFGSKLRQNGLVRAVHEAHNAVLHQVVPTQWTQAEGRYVTKALLERYPEVSVVWAASDQLGIGAAKALEKSGRVLGSTGFTGGLDLSPSGLKSVCDGRLVATAANPLINYGRILIYLHDYINGYDFAAEEDTRIRLKPHLATKENAKRYLELTEKLEDIDFKSFSKVYNKQISEYDFSIERLLANISN